MVIYTEIFLQKAQFLIWTHVYRDFPPESGHTFT